MCFGLNREQLVFRVGKSVPVEYVVINRLVRTGMTVRPIALVGSEPSRTTEVALEAAGLHFDHSIGVWRDAGGRMGVLALTAGTTRTTRTREGVDVSEQATSSTRITKTFEGTDQVETGK